MVAKLIIPESLPTSFTTTKAITKFKATVKLLIRWVQQSFTEIFGSKHSLINLQTLDATQKKDHSNWKWISKPVRLKRASNSYLFNSGQLTGHFNFFFNHTSTIPLYQIITCKCSVTLIAHPANNCLTLLHSQLQTKAPSHKHSSHTGDSRDRSSTQRYQRRPCRILYRN